MIITYSAIDTQDVSHVTKEGPKHNLPWCPTTNQGELTF